MKALIQILFSIFFIIAIASHVYFVIVDDGQPFWWHAIYYITYGGCWWMLQMHNKKALAMYIVLAIFPFVTHANIMFQHYPKLDFLFWIGFIVCIMLIFGVIWIKKTIVETMV